MAQSARVLEPGLDSGTCAKISGAMTNTLSERFSDGSPKYDVTFFQAGDKYYIALNLRQPASENMVAFGLSFVYVFDGNADPIEGVMM